MEEVGSTENDVKKPVALNAIEATQVLIVLTDNGVEEIPFFAVGGNEEARKTLKVNGE